MFGLSPLMLRVAGAALVTLFIAGGGFYAGLRWDAGTIGKQQAQIATLAGNAMALQGGLDRCNASVKDLAAQGNAATDRANAALAKLQATQADLAAARKRLAAVPSSEAVCPSVTAIFDGAFQP